MALAVPAVPDLNRTKELFLPDFSVESTHVTFPTSGTQTLLELCLRSHGGVIGS